MVRRLNNFCRVVIVCVRSSAFLNRSSSVAGGRGWSGGAGTGSGDRREVSLTLKISNRCKPNESCQTNIRKRSVCPQFRPQFPNFLIFSSSESLFSVFSTHSLLSFVKLTGFGQPNLARTFATHKLSKTVKIEIKRIRYRFPIF